MTVSQDEVLRRLLEEQSALRRVATLVARGGEAEPLAAEIAAEIGQLFEAHAANALHWDGSTLRVVGDWSIDPDYQTLTGSVWTFGGDTITARVVESGAPARVESAEDLKTPFARERWQELGLQASLGAPVVIDGVVWGVITVSRTTPDEPFPPGAETRLADFAGLIATAIANADARHELAALALEQTALRRVATLVAGGKPQTEVLEAVAREATGVFTAESVQLLRWTGVLDEVVVEAGWAVPGSAALPPGALYHPGPGSASLCVLETGEMCRAEESSRELGTRSVIAAPVIVNAELLGAIAAFRSPDRPFAPGTEVRLRSFGDLAAQAIANEAARDALRASRARIVRAGDDERRKLERNLHDGAQQRLVAVLIQLRLALARLPDDPERARELLQVSLEELTQAIEELRELARGIHPAILTERGLGAALRLLGERAPFDVTIEHALQGRLPAAVEAAAYYVVAEALTNVAKHAAASSVEVRVSHDDGVACVEVVDDGVGGADAARGSGLRGLADRVEALDGALAVESAPGAGTRVVAHIPLDVPSS